MLKKLYKKNGFILSLARDGKRFTLSYEQKLWAYYNLHMYKSASTFTTEKLSCKGLVAKIISLASCGEFEEAKSTLKFMLKHYDCHKFYIRLIDSLAPFMPHDALVLLETLTNKPTALHAALLLKLGKVEKAKELLKTSILQKEYRTSPELLLYHSNALISILPKKQLTVSRVRVLFLTKYWL